MRRDAETEIERRGSVLTNVNKKRKEKNRDEDGGAAGVWGEWQTTLAAEEKVESMKLVVLAAQSIRSASRAPRSCFFSLVLFDNYANAGMIVGQYVLGIKVESEQFGYLYDSETRNGPSVG